MVQYEEYLLVFLYQHILLIFLKDFDGNPNKMVIKIKHNNINIQIIIIYELFIFFFFIKINYLIISSLNNFYCYLFI